MRAAGGRVGRRRGLPPRRRELALQRRCTEPPQLRPSPRRPHRSVVRRLDTRGVTPSRWTRVAGASSGAAGWTTRVCSWLSASTWARPPDRAPRGSSPPRRRARAQWSNPISRRPARRCGRGDLPAVRPRSPSAPCPPRRTSRRSAAARDRRRRGAASRSRADRGDERVPRDRTLRTGGALRRTSARSHCRAPGRGGRARRCRSAARWRPWIRTTGSRGGTSAAARPRRA